MSMTGLLRRPAGPASRMPRVSTRPMLEALEDRAVPASLSQMTLPLDVSNLQVVTVADGTQQLEGIVNYAGQLAGTLTAILTTEAPAPGGECPILHLEVNELHLAVLGLHVDTSDICLDVTATDHQGLLGGLLCDLSGGGLSLGGLGGILDQLDNVLGQVDTFLGQLDGLLDHVLGQSFAVDTVFGGGGMAAQQAGHTCDILKLSLGPINLDVPLLGVSVDLDNCAAVPGPVTVAVTAVEGEGLLGDLLCGLSDRLGNLTDLVGQLDHGRGLAHQLDQVTRQVERLLDKVDDLADLGQFVAQVGRLTDRLDRLIDRLT